MELNHRRLLIYGLLLLAWGLALGWQTAEHFRVERAARATLIGRANDISTTLGIVLRSQRRFGGIVSRERLNSALVDLVKSDDLNGIALLNASGDVVVASGSLPAPENKYGEVPSVRWDEKTATVMNLVDLGTNLAHDIEQTNPPIVLAHEELFPPPQTNGPANGPPGLRDQEAPTTNKTFGTVNTNTTLRPPPTSESRARRADGPGPSRFFHLPWKGETEHKTMIQKQGVHSFVIVLSTQAMRATCMEDLWLRCVIMLLATVSAVGIGFGWRNLTMSADLQLRLVRASELTAHLKTMNVAAAGLAHETRNPLNIIRGLAQMISKQPNAPPEIYEKSRAILDETDKIAVQLTEFINYSRPRDVRRSVLNLAAAVKEVGQALGYDLEEKQVRLEIQGEAISIEADEQLLRQTLFNLILNAIQAVDPGGIIQVVAGRQGASEGFLEIRDNGPGVLPEYRQEIFKPYFTTHPKGTGLGLAVVKQIVLAHGWDIAYLSRDPKGAIFRISHMKLAVHL